MAQYTNSTPNSNDWKLYFQPSPYSECLVVLIVMTDNIMSDSHLGENIN